MKCDQVIFDGFVKGRKSTKNVIPAKAGIQKQQMFTKALDPGFRRGDDFLWTPPVFAGVTHRGDNFLQVYYV